MLWVILPKSYLHCFDSNHSLQINEITHAASCQLCEAEFDLFNPTTPAEIAFEITEYDFAFDNFYVSPFQAWILYTSSGLSPPTV
jgi:hypothetical protein